MSLDTKMFFELRYKATKNGNIKIFHKDFVDRNKDKCKILYKGKEHEISEYYDFYEIIEDGIMNCFLMYCRFKFHVL